MDMEYLQNQKVSNKPDKKMPAWLAFVLVAILILVGYLFFYKNFVQNRPVINDTLPIGYQFKVMAENKYPVGFPENLIVKGGEWQRAEDTVDGAGNKLKIVEFIYRNMEQTALLSSFQKNLKAAGWTADSAQIFKKNNDTITLTIIAINISGDNLVNITLTTK